MNYNLRIFEVGIQHPRIFGRGVPNVLGFLTGGAKYPRGLGVPVFLKGCYFSWEKLHGDAKFDTVGPFKAEKFLIFNFLEDRMNTG